jgi:alkanesulfonate monooxygenase SsuD/methylene tetrahydromethanopterin reductase-like flavin-dependent oxidoreductase (luciferase family)
VSPTSFRHPSILAKQVATADHVSGGRVELGLGAGWHEREHAAYGFDFASTRTRMDVLEEQLQIVLGSWAAGVFDFAGEHYTLSGLEAHPKPVQTPHPPIIMGGLAGPRSARMAAQYADEYNTVFAGASEVTQRAQRVAGACEAAGRAPLPMSLMTGVVVGEDERELRARTERLAAKLGTDAAELVSAPPPGWIVGTVQQAAERLLELRDAGVHRVMCQQLVHEDLEAVALLGERLAPLVA